ncbi:MAG TPA: hypothetical protein PK926_11235 [Spirochaetota bacterium]|nr:hypothetical protein [Spirochaetota bacterium]HPI91081.1 hypothetical protein [Spirochaetota bacterium]HPR47740.1 hypothetical protein [Spirochaetota bacterium]
MDFHSFFSSESFTTGLKWVAMILVTGFIAQFGKKLAEYIIAKMKKKKDDAAQTKTTEAVYPANSEKSSPQIPARTHETGLKVEKELSKIRKKEAKIKQKELKKNKP